MADLSLLIVLQMRTAYRSKQKVAPFQKVYFVVQNSAINALIITLSLFYEISFETIARVTKSMNV